MATSRCIGPERAGSIRVSPTPSPATLKNAEVSPTEDSAPFFFSIRDSDTARTTTSTRTISTIPTFDLQVSVTAVISLTTVPISCPGGDLPDARSTVEGTLCTERFITS